MRERVSVGERLKEIGDWLLAGVLVACGAMGMLLLIGFSVLLRVLVYGAPIWGTILLIWWLWFT